jgi:NTE family protein
VAGGGRTAPGGGYRAALFHLGTLRRLDEFGAPPKLTTISSVSGGSIVNALPATRLLSFEHFTDGA